MSPPGEVPDLTVVNKTVVVTGSDGHGTTLAMQFGLEINDMGATVRVTITSATRL